MMQLLRLKKHIRLAQRYQSKINEMCETIIYNITVKYLTCLRADSYYNSGERCMGCDPYSHVCCCETAYAGHRASTYKDLHIIAL